jgi:hypothetical protein
VKDPTVSFDPHGVEVRPLFIVRLRADWTGSHDEAVVVLLELEVMPLQELPDLSIRHDVVRGDEGRFEAEGQTR